MLGKKSFHKLEDLVLEEMVKLKLLIRESQAQGQHLCDTEWLRGHQHAYRQVLRWLEEV